LYSEYQYRFLDHCYQLFKQAFPSVIPYQSFLYGSIPKVTDASVDHQVSFYR